LFAHRPSPLLAGPRGRLLMSPSPLFVVPCWRALPGLCTFVESAGGARTLLHDVICFFTTAIAKTRSNTRFGRSAGVVIPMILERYHLINESEADAIFECASEADAEALLSWYVKRAYFDYRKASKFLH